MITTMNYSSFKTFICDHIHSHLPEYYRDGCVKITKVIKSNDEVLESLIIEKPGCFATPNIYLEEYYADYAAGCPLEQILKDIADYRTEFETPEALGMDPILCRAGDLGRFEKVRDKIVPRLINYESSRTYLEDKAFKLIEDLAVTYHVFMPCSETSYSAVITRDMLRGYGVGVEELHRLALKNMNRVMPFWYRGLDTLVAEIIMERGDTEKLEKMKLKRTADGVINDDGTMVLSNAMRCYGAAIILVPEVMDCMGRVLGKDFYIIPSSVHEVILRPRERVEDPQMLRKVIREINRREVDKSERLSDNIYTYDFEKHVPRVCREK